LTPCTDRMILWFVNQGFTKGGAVGFGEKDCMTEGLSKKKKRPWV